MPARDQLTGERGSAVAESVMVLGLIAVLLAGVLQFGVVIYTRNTMIDAASAAARHASLADRTPEDGRARAQQLLRDSVPASESALVTVELAPGQNVDEVTVTITHRVPMLGFVTGPVPLEVSAHAASYPD